MRLTLRWALFYRQKKIGHKRERRPFLYLVQSDLPFLSLFVGLPEAPPSRDEEEDGHPGLDHGKRTVPQFARVDSCKMYTTG
jgi:hypothetical protein